jgi:hypothetical protein
VPHFVPSEWCLSYLFSFLIHPTTLSRLNNRITKISPYAIIFLMSWLLIALSCLAQCSWRSISSKKKKMYKHSWTAVIRELACISTSSDHHFFSSLSLSLSTTTTLEYNWDWVREREKSEWLKNGQQLEISIN